MIIKYPTGLYKNSLPSKPSDHGNVTFTISNTLPPRIESTFLKIPIGVEFREKELPDIGLIDSRNMLGQLAFTVSSAKRANIGNNAKQFEVGQVLEFNQFGTSTVDPMFVSETTQIQHDNNLFDYESIGLTPEDQTTIANAALETYVALTAQLNDTKQKRADAEVTISTQQKTINEITKTINAISVIPGLEAIVNSLQEKLAAVTVVLNAAIEDANRYAAEAAAIADKLRTVSVVVR